MADNSQSFARKRRMIHFPVKMGVKKLVGDHLKNACFIRLSVEGSEGGIKTDKER